MRVLLFLRVVRHEPGNPLGQDEVIRDHRNLLGFAPGLLQPQEFAFQGAAFAPAYLTSTGSLFTTMVGTSRSSVSQ